MDANHWPWWLGGVALAAIAISYTIAMGRPLGVSGLVRRSLGRGEDRKTAWLFLLGLALGGFVAAQGSAEAAAWTFDAVQQNLLGSGWATGAALLGGGALVGFGTSLAGGCTSGHGLMGCARGDPASLAATAAFFGTAVVVSHLFGG